MLLIPLADVPSQIVSAQLPGGQNGQNCTLAIYQESTGLFIDVTLNGSPTPLLAGVVCENLNRIIRSLYLGFIGDLAFFDTQGGADGTGGTDPTTPGLGTQYQLWYFEPTEIGGLG